jgi:hypothetical protein
LKSRADSGQKNELEAIVVSQMAVTHALSI